MVRTAQELDDAVCRLLPALMMSVVLTGGAVELGMALEPATSETTSAEIDFAIERQPLGDALTAYGRYTGYSVSYVDDLVAHRMSMAVEGRHTPEEALRRILFGTGLKATFRGRSAFVMDASGVRPNSARVHLDGLTVLGSGLGDDLANWSYAQRLGREAERLLRARNAAPGAGEKLPVMVWVDEDGRISQVARHERTARPDPLTQRVLEAFLELKVSRPPPPNLPQPIVLKVSAQ